MRYYDPTLGRWTSPDPLGFEDGPNLYAYVHNSPIRYFDRFGLFADEFETSWDPVFPHHSILSFNDIHHGFAGTFQGGVDFLTHQIAGIGSLCCAIGANEWEDPEDRLFSTLAFAESTAGHLHHFDNWTTKVLCIDPGNPIYRQHRVVTTTALEVGSLAVGGYELAKGAMGLARFARFSQQAKFAGSLVSGDLQLATQSLASTLESRIGQLNVPKRGVTNVARNAGRKRFSPDTNAVGTHSVFRRDPITNRITHYETYRAQTNPFNPNPWESVVRFDNSGKFNQSHFNKVLDKFIFEPHVHDPKCLGGIRPAMSWEIP